MAGPRPLWRTYLAFLGPMVLANILQSLSGSVNGVYIGQMLGTDALAAVAGMFPVVFFFIALVIGVGAGASVLIGQAWGAREPHKVKAIAGTALALGALIGLLAAVLGEVFARPALVTLGTAPELLPDAAAYGAVNQIVNYVQFPALSIAITASILGAQAIGAGRVERLSAIVRTGLLLNAVLTGALVLLGYALSHRLLGFFITTPHVLVMAQGLLYVMLWGSVVFGMQAVVAGVMRASGTVWVPTGISVASIVLVQLPAAHALSARFGLPGVWMSYPVVFSVMLALQSAFYLLVWRYRRIERLV